MSLGERMIWRMDELEKGRVGEKMTIRKDEQEKGEQKKG